MPRLDDLATRFRSKFGRNLAQFVSITGFDIVGFDEKFIKSGDASMADVIEAKYGKDAVALIEELIHHN